MTAMKFRDLSIGDEFHCVPPTNQHPNPPVCKKVGANRYIIPGAYFNAPGNPTIFTVPDTDCECYKN